MVSRPALPVSPSVLLAEAVPLWGAKRLSCGMGVLLGTPTVGITQIYPHKVPWAWLRAQSCIFVGQWWGFWGRRWVFCGVLVFFFLLPPHSSRLCTPSLATTLLLVLEIKPLPSKFPSSSLGGLEG